MYVPPADAQITVSILNQTLDAYQVHVLLVPLSSLAHGVFLRAIPPYALIPIVVPRGDHTVVFQCVAHQSEPVLSTNRGNLIVCQSPSVRKREVIFVASPSMPL